jgi:hypothetical protein
MEHISLQVHSSVEILKYKLYFVEVQEVRWYRGGIKPTSDYMFFYGKGNEFRELGTGPPTHKKIMSAFRKVELLSDRMLYIIIRGH